MAISPISEFLQNIRRATLRRDEAGWTDGQLLDIYVQSREEAAFAALLHRHGPMVWGVCRRVLGNEGDAEDAFQATFLVLVRKAASIVPREQIANWLHGVARQTAVKARAMAVKRKAREKQVKDMPELAIAEQNGRDEWLPLLDQELGRLPEKYRTAIVLCDLEGKSYKEAAGQLGCPEGTLAARLARGRAMLSKRLARHGLTVTSGMLATMLSQSASASVPASVLSTTMKAASSFAEGQAAATAAISVQVAALAEGVLKTMLLSKLKIATAVFLGVAVAGVGIGRCLYPVQRADSVSKRQERKEENTSTPSPNRSDNSADKKTTAQRADNPAKKNIDAQAENPRAKADTKPTPPVRDKPVDKEAWARKLAALNDADWREAFEVGQELAALPADEGFTILQENWEKVTKIDARQQFLKAWYWTLIIPGARPHPRLLDVLDLGVRDRSPEVQTWAFGIVHDFAFQELAEDFQAYKAWYQANRRKPAPQVIAESAKRLVDQAAKARGKEANTLAKYLNERARMFSLVPASRQAAVDAGLLGILERWVAGAEKGKRQDDSELAKQALDLIANLKPDEAYMRRVVVPLLAKDKSAELRVSALEALSDKRNAWAFDLILDVFKNSLQDDERSFQLIVQTAAKALAKIGNPKAIPVMIAVIDADNNYGTVYGVGYFGLRHLTGVEYDESHKGPWWRQWWDKNKERYPTARRLEIPKLTKSPLAEVIDVPALDLRAGGDANKRYFLIGVREGAKPPAGGYGLLIVVPGGDGSAEFHPFVRRIYKNVLNERWLIAQAVAPKWDDKQFDQVVWPREGLRYPAAKFTTEEFLEAVLTDVKAKTRVDAKRVFLLGWSSGGPPCYSLALRKGSPVSGAFIAMSVFKAEQMPALENAKGKAFYLLQSPEDDVTPIRFAVAAEKALRAAGAEARLQRYEGGHGWQGDVWQNIGNGLTWLERQVSR